jgi:hypothetical protein|tara:strand:+ start:37 stop:360 length:324 start_codon:yes stop_codon:yes gene_type:complete
MNPIKSIYDLTSNEMEVRAFGRDVMDLSFIEKDDVRANTLSDLGYRLSNFGELFGMKAKDITPEEEQLIIYAQKEVQAPKNAKKLQRLRDLQKEKLEKAFIQSSPVE